MMLGRRKRLPIATLVCMYAVLCTGLSHKQVGYVKVSLLQFPYPGCIGTSELRTRPLGRALLDKCPDAFGKVAALGQARVPLIGQRLHGVLDAACFPGHPNPPSPDNQCIRTLAYMTSATLTTTTTISSTSVWHLRIAYVYIRLTDPLAYSNLYVTNDCEQALCDTGHAGF